MKSKKKEKYKSHIKYRKKAVKRIEITFLNERDKDIIDYLKAKGNATYIKELIIKDFEKSKAE